MQENEKGLDQLFANYKRACPDRDPSSSFMPELWRKIDERESFLFSFEHIARGFAAVSAALCLLLLLLNYGWGTRAKWNDFSYPDVLAANHSPEQTFFTEGVRGAADVDDTYAR